MRKTHLIGIGISIIFLYLAFRNFNYNEFITNVQQIDQFYLIIAIAIYLFGFIMRGIRWKYILSPIKNIDSKNCISILLIGYMANALLPMRLGEIVRAFILGIKENISKLASLSSIILERIFDGFTLGIFLCLAILLLPASNLIKNISFIAFFIFIGCMIAGIILVHKKEKGLQVIQYIFTHLFKSVSQKAQQYAERFISGLELLNNPKMTIMIFLFSIIIWLNEALIFYALLLAFHIQLPNLYVIAFFTMIMVNLGIMIPSAPGNIGTYNYFCILALTFFGVAYDTALAYSIVAVMTMYIFAVIFGIICMSYMGFSMSQLKEGINKF